ncbi:MAG TPA: alpha/beta hydrolase [Bacteroidales bacterium]|nr:alpha/beta hydrolase [Bacteroidales bacterium]
MRPIPLFLLFTTIFSTNLSNAQRTGNIVGIFGKEKIETIEEGFVFHEFTEGLVLRNAIRPGLLTGTQDIVFWLIATNQFERPLEGSKLNQGYDNDPEGRVLMWEAIEADTNGIFRGDLNRAYVYTEFESPEETIALLDATGHTRVFVNGLPREGDHYDYGYTLIPFKLQKGLNQFVYTYGRFGRVSSKIVLPGKPVQFTPRDLTLPSVIRGENHERWGSVRVINATDEPLTGYSIVCLLETGEELVQEMDHIISLTARKVKFRIPFPVRTVAADLLMATLVLKNNDGEEFDRLQIKLNVKDANRHHERTFISQIDGSVQYYSVAPSTSDAPGQAFVLSVHGASVEATNQTRAYKQKDGAHIVAPTNRRPFGFNWEEWGRLDALEVLHEARKIFNTDPALTYLTGHSMGGHGTWFLGATYPDKWAAIAPAAGYPDIIGYRRTGVDSAMFEVPHFEMIWRGASPGRVVDLSRNYLQSGVYVLHGSADAVVPVSQARMMRKLLGQFHNNFAYYEYPGGSHWYGDHCMDWPPLFDFFRQNTIPALNEVDSIEFHTASPGVSASNYWLSINQQINPYEISRVKAVKRGDTIRFETSNVASVSFRVSQLDFEKQPVIVVEDRIIEAEPGNDITLQLRQEQWHLTDGAIPQEKNPGRYGGFKLAFTNNMVFVYATNGSAEENEWYENKARFDAETFWYRGNGSIEIIPDFEFAPDNFADRNVIIYGNADNNLAWNQLLAHCPVQVKNGSISFGERVFDCESLGAYFIYPRPESPTASVGVVASSGAEGMKALYPNDYFSGITGFPDLLIFDIDWIKESLDGVIVSGFFGNDWSVKGGKFVE